MLEHYFVKPSTVDRIRASWLGSEIERYVEWMHAQGHATRSIVRRVPLLCDFAEFAKQRGAADVRGAMEQIDAFVEFRHAQRDRQRRHTGPSWPYIKTIRSPVGQMLRLAAEGCVVAPRKKKPFPFQSEAPGFLSYLREERGDGPATVERYAHGLGRFHAYLIGIGAKLTHVSPALLAAFVIDIAPGLSASSRAGMCSTVRVFLRYCHREGIVADDLAATIEVPRNYKLAALPRSISWDDVRRVLAAVDRRTATGRRDYAILLLLVTYGLRAGEVARLRLDDIDWKRDRLHIPDRKAGNSTAYPLASPVAQALVDYIRSGRPETDDRRVFFRVVAPRAPLGPAGVTCRALTYLRRAGVQVPHPGSHTLRHACVKRLVDAQLPFKTVGDYVGHRCSEATAAYAKIDLTALREVALGDGEQL